MARSFKLFYYFIFLIFLLSNCSFKNPVGFFDDRLKELEDEVAKKNSKLIFTESKKFNKEIKGNFDGKLTRPITNLNWLENNLTSSNHVPNLLYEDSKRRIYKSKKIGINKFNISNQTFEPLIFDNNIFLYDPLGNIYKFSIENEKLVWKFNFYKKQYKNIPIQIKIGITNEKLIISDNLGYLYSLEIESGNLVWAKNYGVPFRSNIKINDSNIFLLNQDNKFYIINEEDGEKVSSFETFPSILKSQQETNISLNKLKKTIYFTTSTGQLYSINYKTRNLNWLINLSLTKASGQTSEKLFFSSPISSRY